MNELFGIPTTALAVVLAGALVVGLGVVAVLALRNRVFLRLGVRNVRRRPGRSALIVVGLMLGTAIIAAALATGDTMSHTIRTSAISSLGQTDEIVSVEGADVELMVESGSATGTLYFAEGYVDQIEDAVAGSPLVDGVTPAIVEPVAVLDETTRQNEPRVTLFAADPERFEGFGVIRTSAGEPVSLGDLGPGEAYLNEKAAEELGARPGDRLAVLATASPTPFRVKAVVAYDGAGTDGSALLLPLATAQELLVREGLVKHALVSNRGDEVGGAGLTDEVVRLLEPTLAPLGLEADTAKKDALEGADVAGSAFMSFFATFGSFSIAAGILLIFLIFVMLAAERRGELGIARAVGTRRGHLVQLFLFEGVAYDLLAAAAGALVGVAVAYAMVLVMAGALAASSDFEISYSVAPRSLLVAYALGVLLTLLVVGFSAWRVSRMNIVAAIRDLPEPPADKGGKRRRLLGLAGLAAGALLAVAGVTGANAVVLGLGISLAILSAVPLARAVGVPDRPARTVAGLALVTWFLLPATVTERLTGELSVDFSIFILAGLMIVVGITWTIVYNADVLLGGLSRSLGRVRSLAPVLKMAMAYPLRSLFRTGVTLAMFTLVVFTLVVGATTSGAFANAFNDLEEFGGGFHVRATTSPVAPITNIDAALAEHGDVASGVAVSSSQSFLPVEARQLDTTRSFEPYAVRGLDRAFLDHTTYRLAARATGYESSDDIWRALRDTPGLAVVDAAIVPRRANFSFGVITEFALDGFFLEDETFAPVRVTVRDPQAGRDAHLTVIGVLSETAPLDLQGILTSQETLEEAFGERVKPTTHLFALEPGADAEATARGLETAFLANGMEADALEQVLADAVGANLTFNRLVQGFMGLGLIVGVAALGVVTARSVVERRQQIGVLRAIGFRRRMVQASFLLEASFVALTSIVVGTGLGLLVAFNVVNDARRAPSWSNLSFDVPWLNLGVIFLAVYVVALLTTFAPALRASRVYPAEALRYQ